MSFTLVRHVDRDIAHQRRAVPVIWRLTQFAKGAGCSTEAQAQWLAVASSMVPVVQGRPYLRTVGREHYGGRKT